MNIETLSRKEKIELLQALEESLNWHTVATLCMEDVKSYIEENELTMPDDEALKNACSYVAGKAEIDHSHLWQWAYEVATED
jgi:hypothetical protein